METLIKLLPLCFALFGCASAPAGEEPGLQITGQERVEEGAAFEAIRRSDFRSAASLFLVLADRSPAAVRPHYRLLAAEALLAGKQVMEAAEVLEGTEANTPRDQARKQLLTARMELERRDPRRTLSVLQGFPKGSTEPPLAAEYHRLRALAFEAISQRLDAAREYVSREPLLKEGAAVADNQQQLWGCLEQLPNESLTSYRTTPPEVLSGWIELARLARSGANKTAMAEQLEAWRGRYQGHPAQPPLLDQMMADRKEESLPLPRRIAVLLPLSGRLAEAGNAVRDGVVAAHFQNSGREGLTLRFYDVASDEGVEAIYDQAVGEGAEYVLGPLSKEAVDRLARRDDLPVPTLVLNSTDSTRARNLFQFSLAPEEEAARAAERAWNQGLRRAAVVVPEGPFGDRMATAFEDRWRSLGGAVAASARYNPQESDFAEPIEKMLRLNESNARQRRLTALLGQPVEFTPHRRQDIDLIFLAAYPKQARLMLPQLKFHHAGDIPVFATSHLYGGVEAAELDNDLDGVRFSDMPWVLTAQQLPGRRYEGQLLRLVAFGADAYDLLFSMDRLRQSGAESFGGRTGSLAFGDGHRVVRYPAWGEFKNGVVRELPNPERGDAGN